MDEAKLTDALASQVSSCLSEQEIPLSTTETSTSVPPNEFLLTFTIDMRATDLARVVIEVPVALVNQIFDSAARSQIPLIKAQGFSKDIPLVYIKKNYRVNLIEHVKEFLFKFCVISFLYQELQKRKINIAGDPRLIEIDLEPDRAAFFHFDITLSTPISFSEWKYFSFKAPRRKNYKDLDRQVETFIAEETQKRSETDPTKIGLHDWIYLVITLLNYDGTPLTPSIKSSFWYRVGDEEIESPLKEFFLGKSIGQTVISDCKGLQDYFSDVLNTNYLFQIHIVDSVPHGYFCFDLFKHHFRIKTIKDLHKKLIEAFSYRNDISQRRAMVEESLVLLTSKHELQVPNHLLLRQQKSILDTIKDNPDYNVYRRQADFQQRMQELAYRQAREMVLVDQLSYKENIHISHDDIKGYLNLTKRARTREFLYFELPDSNKHGQEVPVSLELLRQTCLREKAVNYIIYYLTKK